MDRAEQVVEPLCEQPLGGPGLPGHGGRDQLRVRDGGDPCRVGEAAESHARDGPVESSAAWQLRDCISRGELLVECLGRVDCLGQRNQAVNQCAIANELAARAPECIGVDLVECSG